MQKNKIKFKEKNIENTVGANCVRPNSKGITLVALIITIIVMLILIGVIVSTVLKGDLFNIAKKASVETRASMVEEKVAEWKSNKKINEYLEENSNTQSLEELLNDLETQQLITNEERKEIEENMEVTIGNKNIELLPDGYTRCEYLQSHGTTHIRIDDVFETQNDKFEIKIENKNHFTAAFAIGSWESAQGFGCFYINGMSTYTEKVGYISYAFSGTQRIESVGRTYNTKQEFIIEYSKEGVYNKGELISKFAEQPDKKLTYFLHHLDETKTYYFKHYRKNKLIHYLLPVIDSNNNPCMYDTVTGRTFYNQGTGEFIAGYKN